jgi:hypothetical protein
MLLARVVLVIGWHALHSPKNLEVDRESISISQVDISDLRDCDIIVSTVNITEYFPIAELFTFDIFTVIFRIRIRIQLIFEINFKKFR